MGSESQFQSKVKKFLESNGFYVVNVHGGAWGGKGTADLICCYRGRFIAFELKVGENQLSEAQKIRKQEVELSGVGYSALGLFLKRRNCKRIEEMGKWVY